MPNFKTTKHHYDGIDFMSECEVKMYQLLKEHDFNKKWTYQPEHIEIMPKYKATSGKHYHPMNYEPDFLIKAGHKWEHDGSEKETCKHCGLYKCGKPMCKGEFNILLEVKGKNDMVYTFRKGQKPSIKDNSELYRLRHKVIDNEITKNGDIFLVVRDGNLKTPEFAGLFWEKDFEQMKKFKSQGRKDLCAKVPRIMDRIKMILGDY